MPRFFVQHMRGYRPEFWVMDSENVGNGTAGEYRHREQADRFAQLRNDGVRREVAMQAVSNGCEVVRDGDLVFLDKFRSPLIPAKIVKLERVPRPGGANEQYTHVQVTVRLTAARPGYKRGEVLVFAGSECDSVIPRKSVRVKDGHIRIASGVFDI